MFVCGDGCVVGDGNVVIGDGVGIEEIGLELVGFDECCLDVEGC